jgi:hypothetical protein
MRAATDISDAFQPIRSLWRGILRGRRNLPKSQVNEAYLRQHIWFGPRRRKVLSSGEAAVRRAEPARRLGANEGQGALLARPLCSLRTCHPKCDERRWHKIHRDIKVLCFNLDKATSTRTSASFEAKRCDEQGRKHGRCSGACAFN